MEKPQTICLLNDSFPPIIDGVANAVINYAGNIERNHGHAIVVTPAVPKVDDGAYPFPVLRYPSIDTRKLVGYVAGYPFSPEIAGQLAQEQVSLLHTHCPVSSCILARSLREVVDAPLVLTYHTKYDIDIAKAIHGKFLQTSAIRALVQNVSSCDEVWVVSRGAGENLRSLGYEGEYIVMENGVDVPQGCVSEEKIKEAAKDYDLPQNVPTFLFVGRLMWYKGLRIILDALSALKEKNIPFRMVFVGDGADGAEVRQYASEKRLDDCCFFTGAISDREVIRAWYARADLFLFPSTFDTNGLVVREAAASGTATVMVRGSCASEGVTEGRNGFFIEENAFSLAAMLCALCAVPEKMRQVGECAQKELYVSWETAVAHAFERYQIVIDRYKGGHYEKHRKPMDELLKSQGELMEALANIDKTREGIISDIRFEHRERMEERIDRRQELRDELLYGQDELQNRFREVRQELEEAKEAFWQKMDQYL